MWYTFRLDRILQFFAGKKKLRQRNPDRERSSTPTRKVAFIPLWSFISQPLIKQDWKVKFKILRHIDCSRRFWTIICDYYLCSLHDATMKHQLTLIISDYQSKVFESKLQIPKPGQDHELNPKSWLTKEDEGCSFQPSWAGLSLNFYFY